MIESSSTIEIFEKTDSSKKEYYCKINLYSDCETVKVINKRFIGTIVRKGKSINKKDKYVVVAGTGFLRSFVKLWGSSFQDEVRKTGTEFIYINSVIGLNPVFASFNENSAFILPEKDIRRMDKIWQI